MNTHEIVASTAEPAFAVDAGGRVVAWNTSAGQFLGYRGSWILGRRCYAVLAGLDLQDNTFCQQRCPLVCSALRHEPIQAVEFRLRIATGQRRRAVCRCLAFNGSESAHLLLVHLLAPVPPRVDAAGKSETQPVARPPTAAAPPRRLTRRETEVLRYLTAGVGTQRIAQLLFVSVTTVRNHIQNILRKLGAHSRLEAVAVARRDGLLH